MSGVFWRGVVLIVPAGFVSVRYECRVEVVLMSRCSPFFAVRRRFGPIKIVVWLVL